ncbi:hypothetical protein FE374_11120 [Georgenia yuyongxinii]|uniref:Uncharacterized protein n=1 Tax=Georgenia yuyongxinii TaxID=2589797 RepID=A0A5B8C6Q1_9MICO|nr:hypothetical protein [Georgenia yuyongxinii]QDC25081.1 hypothetical protein FE374_11120 [Georgenia yuyongxinii]
MSLVKELPPDGGPLARPTAASFWRTLAAGALGGGLAGLLVGGVLGRLVMRVLAVTSPSTARGQMTDDLARVGEISLRGTVTLFVTTIALGAIAGLIYLWVRRVLPPSRRARSGLFALFTGSIGGAFFVHDHPSFDFSALRPEWLAVVTFVAIPAGFGLLAPAVVDRLEAPGGWARRAPVWLVLVAGAAALHATLVFVALPLAAAFGLSRSEAVLRAWRSDAVTAAGRILFVLLVVWGLYGITADVVSIATDTPSTWPLHP